MGLKKLCRPININKLCTNCQQNNGFFGWINETNQSNLNLFFVLKSPARIYLTKLSSCAFYGVLLFHKTKKTHLLIKQRLIQTQQYQFPNFGTEDPEYTFCRLVISWVRLSINNMFETRFMGTAGSNFFFFNHARPCRKCTVNCYYYFAERNGTKHLLSKSRQFLVLCYNFFLSGHLQLNGHN